MLSSSQLGRWPVSAGPMLRRPRNSAIPFRDPKASIVIPQIAGGGAEKIVMRLARLLDRQGRLSRVYAGTRNGAAQFGDLNLVILDAPRALQASTPFLHRASADPADTFLLTLGYVNLAPLLRLRRPFSRIVVRIGSILSAEASYRPRLSRLRYLASIRFACRFADQIVVQGEYMAEDLMRYMPWARKKLRIIHNFVEDELWAHEAGARPLHEPYLFCAATFRPEKAFDILLAAYSRSFARSTRKLVIAGISPDDAAFRVLMEENDLADDEVIRLGYVQTPYDWIAHSELCVLASRYEGFSNFLIEAGALGKRIIATSCPGGNAEFFRFYSNARTVPVDDVGTMAEALNEPRRDLPRAEARASMRWFELAKVQEDYLSALFE